MSGLNKLLKRIIENRKISSAEKLQGVKQVFALDQRFREQKHERCQLDLDEKYKVSMWSAAEKNKSVFIEMDPLALAVNYCELDLVKHLSKPPFNVASAIFVAIYQERTTKDQVVANKYLTILRFLLSKNPVVNQDLIHLSSQPEYQSIYRASQDRPSYNIMQAFESFPKLLATGDQLISASSLPDGAELKKSEEKTTKNSIPICYAQAKLQLLAICKLDSLLAIDYITERLRETRGKNPFANMKPLKPVFLDFVSQLIEWFTMKDAMHPDVHARLAERLLTRCHFSPKLLAEFVLASAHTQAPTTDFLQNCGKKFLAKKPEKALKSLWNLTRQLVLQGVKKLKTPEYQFIIDTLLVLWSNHHFALQGPLAEKEKRNELLTSVLKGNQPVQALDAFIRKPGEVLGFDGDGEQKVVAAIAPSHLSIWIRPELIDISRGQGRRFSM